MWLGGEESRCVPADEVKFFGLGLIFGYGRIWILLNNNN